MTSNGKQFTVTREMLTAVAGISARYSKFALVLFCYITNHLMTGPLGNSEFCFPRISMFPSTSSRVTLRFSGNKIHCSPRDQSLSVYCCTLAATIQSTFYERNQLFYGIQHRVFRFLSNVNIQAKFHFVIFQILLFLRSTCCFQFLCSEY